MTEQLSAFEPAPARARPGRYRLLALALASVLASPSVAATITISDTPFAGTNAATSSIHDNFASFSTCSQDGAITTSVGSFSPGGRAGGGGSVCGRNNSEQVRSGENYGRDGHAYLDSNDVSRLKWTLPSDTRKVQFVLQDVNDRPGTKGFKLTAGSATETIHRQANGALNYVTVLFDPDEVKEIGMHMWRKTTKGFDGFGLTGVKITHGPAPVPLPASAFLLAGGLGALALVRRRRSAAQ
ncbi:MAG: VPLPA-CTERM sorting domain-containing protein [Amaricoccus sp.]